MRLPASSSGARKSFDLVDGPFVRRRCLSASARAAREAIGRCAVLREEVSWLATSAADAERSVATTTLDVAMTFAAADEAFELAVVRSHRHVQAFQRGGKDNSGSASVPRGPAMAVVPQPAAGLAPSDSVGPCGGPFVSTSLRADGIAPALTGPLVASPGGDVAASTPFTPAPAADDVIAHVERAFDAISVVCGGATAASRLHPTVEPDARSVPVTNAACADSGPPRRSVEALGGFVEDAAYLCTGTPDSLYAGETLVVGTAPMAGGPDTGPRAPPELLPLTRLGATSVRDICTATRALRGRHYDGAFVASAAALP